MRSRAIRGDQRSIRSVGVAAFVQHRRSKSSQNGLVPGIGALGRHRRKPQRLSAPPPRADCENPPIASDLPRNVTPSGECQFESGDAANGLGRRIESAPDHDESGAVTRQEAQPLIEQTPGARPRCFKTMISAIATKLSPSVFGRKQANSRAGEFLAAPPWRYGVMPDRASALEPRLHSKRRRWRCPRLRGSSIWLSRRDTSSGPSSV